MSIELGLSRVRKLLKLLPKAGKLKCVHVAGTNGKGSTLAYVSSILNEANIRHGRFTSPHTMSVNDCVTINRQVLPMDSFKKAKKEVQEHNDDNGIGCTEFEILTCAVYMIFAMEHLELSLIEVGLGGRLDATNILNEDEVLVSAITKVGIDHESFLGDTISQIAKEKAGIIKKGVDCVVDSTNNKEALQAIREKASHEGSPLHEVSSSPLTRKLIELSPLKGKYQEQNLAVALEIVSLLKEKHSFKISDEAIKRGITKTSWPGRLQTVKDPKTGIEVLIDGAHNESAAIELAAFLESYRDGDKGIIFVVALTKGKSVENLLKHIVKADKDTIIPTEFSPPEDMPWVKCYDTEYLAQEAKKYANLGATDIANPQDLFAHLQSLKQQGDDRKIVVCGSLYLCADILRAIDYAPTI
ncbi:hypothetical protein FT663_00030 [Candidozyma haemuli var. vulneris]|uniref:Dihydrofolate synthetase n=1 Tax=Candidozyma haemuli TaxID=45357 RepID=A0A2V1AUK8_9ASCO|nr:hypothetical protein CXQ85_000819 [[Candida] haemuloni]KAF3994010.1 hypothetical protein FT662_00196 [[Candida] haemuloni var. vulneris]KAF3995807.1 hypothetical protein FT663_00030 [[Candida] haemuloni var. vulneris]PVH21827.1 hypothetical protein CXQ85_000819 [[Candida] haemuloni]